MGDVEEQPVSLPETRLSRKIFEELAQLFSRSQALFQELSVFKVMEERVTEPAQSIPQLNMNMDEYAPPGPDPISVELEKSRPRRIEVLSVEEIKREEDSMISILQSFEGCALFSLRVSYLLESRALWEPGILYWL